VLFLGITVVVVHVLSDSRLRCNISLGSIELCFLSSMHLVQSHAVLCGVRRYICRPRLRYSNVSYLVIGPLQVLARIKCGFRRIASFLATLVSFVPNY